MMEWIMALCMYIPWHVAGEGLNVIIQCVVVYHVKGLHPQTATAALELSILLIGLNPTSDFIAIRFISAACTGSRGRHAHTLTHTPRTIIEANSISRRLVYSQMVNLP